MHNEKCKRVNFLINDLKLVGGAERLITELAIGLADSGWEPQIYTLASNADRLKRGKKSIKHNKLNFKNLLGLFNCDVVHVSLFPSLYIISFLSLFLKRKGQKLIFHEHNTYNNRRRYKIFRLIDSIVYSRFDIVICISHATKNSLDEWLFFGSKKRIVIHNFSCFNDKNIVPLKRAKKFKIGMAGAASPQKNQQFLIDFVKKNPNKDYELNLIGPNIFSNFQGIDTDVKLWSDPTEVSAFYDYIDVYVHAANWEGFGLVAVEACRRGRPILLPSIPGISEVVMDTRYLYENYDFDDLAMKLELIREDISAAVDHSKLVADFFSIESFIKKYKELLS